MIRMASSRSVKQITNKRSCAESDDDFPPLLNRLILVIENSRQRVGKYSERFLKGYAMSLQV